MMFKSLESRRHRRNLPFTCALFLSSLISLSASGQAPAAENLRDDVAGALRGSQFATDVHFTSTFEVRRLMERLASDKSDWDLDQWRQLDHITYIVCHDSYTMTRRMNEVPISATVPQREYQQVVMWRNGEAWTRADNEKSVSITASVVTGDMSSLGFLFSQIDGRFPAHRPLADVVEESHPIASSREGDDATYRFALNRETANSAQFSVTMHRWADRPLLHEYVSELSDAPTSGSFGDHVYYKSVFRILRWQETDAGRMIPAEAELLITGPVNTLDHDSDQGTAKIIYTRQEFGLLGPDCKASTSDPISLDPGTKVYDDRLNLNYEIGRDYLYWDGTMYHLDTPLLEPPSDDLDVLLANARPAPIAPAPVPDDTTDGSEDHRPLRERFAGPLLVAVAVMLGVTGSFMLWVRRRTCA